MSCKHGMTDEIIYDYVSGNTDVVLTRRIEKHLKVCDYCLESYQWWTEMSGTIDEVPKPTPKLKKYVMKQVRWEKQKDSIFKQPSILFASISFAVFLFFIGVTVGQQSNNNLGAMEDSLPNVIKEIEGAEELEPFMVKEETNMYEILPELNENIKGYVWINQNSNEMMLLVDGLPQVSLKDYQGWVQTPQEVRSAGVVKTSGETGVVYYQDWSIKTLEQIMLSREPLGGSDELTDPNPMLIQLNSR